MKFYRKVFWKLLEWSVAFVDQSREFKKVWFRVELETFVVRSADKLNRSGLFLDVAGRRL